MDKRVPLLLFIVSSFWCCNARDLTSAGFNEVVSAVQHSNNKLSGGEHMEEVIKNETLCSLCEDFSAEALKYLSENKTETEIIKILHKTCHKIRTVTKQCISLVDYYAPLFFVEVSSIEPDGFCQKFGLCEAAVSIPLHHSKNNTCDLCHNVVTEALLKIKDPDSELELVKLLMKACNSMGKNVKKCKRFVFEYAPIILVEAEKFIETNDVCTILHACNEDGEAQAVTRTDTDLQSASQ